MGSSPRNSVLLLTLLATFAAASVRADEAPLPDWMQVGQTLSSGYSVTGIERHPEYVRLWFTGEGIQTGVEIGFQDKDAEAGNDWTTRHFRLQPAPGTNPPRELLVSLMKALRDLENDRDNPLLRSIATRPERQPRTTSVSDGQVPSIRAFFSPQALVSIVLALILIIVYRLWRRKTRPESSTDGRAPVNTITRLLAGLVSSPLPIPKPTRRLPAPMVFLLEISAVAIPSYLVLSAFLPAEIPIQIDMAREILIASRYNDMGLLAQTGGASSFNGLYHGTAAILVWRVVMGLGLEPQNAYPIVLALNALAIGVMFHGTKRLLGILPAIAAALIFGGLNLSFCRLSLVWSFSLAPLPLALLFAVATAFVQTPSRSRAVAAGMALGLTAETHVFALVLLPSLLLFTGTAGRTTNLRKGYLYSLMATAAMFSTMMLLSPGSWLINLRILLLSGYLIPALLGLSVFPAVGSILSGDKPDGPGGTKAVATANLTLLVTAAGLVALTLYSGKKLEYRYAFIMIPGVAFLAAQILNFPIAAFRGRNRKKRWISALVCLLALGWLVHLHPYSYVPTKVASIRKNNSSDAPTMDSYFKVIRKLSELGLSPWEMKWSVQTLGYSAFVRMLEVNRSPRVNHREQLDSNTAWQLIRLKSKPVGLPDNDEIFWFPSKRSGGLMMERITPWIQKAKMEVCVKNDESSTPPSCASVSPEIMTINNERPQGISVPDDQIGPLNYLMSLAFKGYSPGKAGRTGIRWFLPVETTGPDTERLLVLANAGNPKMTTNTESGPGFWRITEVRNLEFDGRLPATKIAIRHKLPGPEGPAGLTLECDLENPWSYETCSTPVWFEISPSRQKLWDLSDAGEPDFGIGDI